MRAAESKTNTVHASQRSANTAPFFRTDESRDAFFGPPQSDVAFFKSADLKSISDTSNKTIQRHANDAITAPLVTPDIDAIVSQTDAGLLSPKSKVGPKEQQRQQLMKEVDETGKALSDLEWYDLDAHPKHKDLLWSQVFDIIKAVAAELSKFKLRIQKASKKKELQLVDSELAVFSHGRKLTLRIQISRIISRFREQEKLWLIEFILHDKLTKDPVSFNNAAQKSSLEFIPGVESMVKVITRIKYLWDFTDKAKKAAKKAKKAATWTSNEKNAYKEGFQRQLNSVWNSKNQASAAFKVTEPLDYLLKNEVLKWSNLNAQMQGEAQDVNDPASPGAGLPEHFTITVKKQAANEKLRANIETKTGTFYTGNEKAGYDAAGNPDGNQHTLAHEWVHMIGQPDEYTENSESQSKAWIDGNAVGKPTGLGSDQWTLCQNTLKNRIAGTKGESLAERQQAQKDLDSLKDQYKDSDPVKNGDQDNIYNVSRNAPDECFAIRGPWSGPGSTRLRPGSQSQRGGTWISASPEDEQRLTDEGNKVHPYHREGVLEQTNNLLKDNLNPVVQLEHNIPDNDFAQQLEIIQVRLNNVLRDWAGP